MKLEGNIKKQNNWWAIEVPLLFVFTQGKTKKEALSMVKDSIETLIDRKGFKVSIGDVSSQTFSIKANNLNTLMAFVLKQQRSYYNKSIRDVAQKLGSSSPTAYSQYESGRTKLNLDKFTQILEAIHKDNEPILKLAN